MGEGLGLAVISNMPGGITEAKRFQTPQFAAFSKPYKIATYGDKTTTPINRPAGLKKDEGHKRKKPTPKSGLF
jgi:hypothetical protein